MLTLHLLRFESGAEPPEPQFELVFAPRRFYLPAASTTNLKHAVRAGATWDMEVRLGGCGSGHFVSRSELES